MNLGGKFVAMDGGRRHMQSEENSQRAKIHYEERQLVVYLWLPSKEEEAREEMEKALRGNRFAILAAESEQVFSRRA